MGALARAQVHRASAIAGVAALQVAAVDGGALKAHPATALRQGIAIFRGPFVGALTRAMAASAGAVSRARAGIVAAIHAGVDLSRVNQASTACILGVAMAPGVSALTSAGIHCADRTTHVPALQVGTTGR